MFIEMRIGRGPEDPLDKLQKNKNKDRDNQDTLRCDGENPGQQPNCPKPKKNFSLTQVFRPVNKPKGVIAPPVQGLDPVFLV